MNRSLTHSDVESLIEFTKKGEIVWTHGEDGRLTSTVPSMHGFSMLLEKKKCWKGGQMHSLSKPGNFWESFKIQFVAVTTVEASLPDSGSDLWEAAWDSADKRKDEDEQRTWSLVKSVLDSKRSEH